LQSADLKKSGRNTFQKYSYFELSDFMPTIIQAESDFGFVNLIGFEPIDGEVFAVLTIKDEADEIRIMSPIADAGVKGVSAIQALGAVHTYLRRYLYVMAYEISEHDAIDGMDQNAEPKAAKRTQSAPDLTPPGTDKKTLVDQITDVVKADLNLKSLVDQHKAAYGAEKITDLSVEHLESLYRLLTEV
jgi:hypothetical protein